MKERKEERERERAGWLHGAGGGEEGELLKGDRVSVLQDATPSGEVGCTTV